MYKLIQSLILIALSIGLDGKEDTEICKFMYTSKYFSRHWAHHFVVLKCLWRCWIYDISPHNIQHCIHITAFSAYTSDFYYMSNGDVVRFDGIYDEHGPGFNSMVGVFVCPTHGIYQFSASIIQWQTSVEATVSNINMLRPHQINQRFLK